LDRLLVVILSLFPLTVGCAQDCPVDRCFHPVLLLSVEDAASGAPLPQATVVVKAPSGAVQPFVMEAVGDALPGEPSYTHEVVNFDEERLPDSEMKPGVGPFKADVVLKMTVEATAQGYQTTSFGVEVHTDGCGGPLTEHRRVPLSKPPQPVPVVEELPDPGICR
jgi:hypothetical protein